MDDPAQPGAPEEHQVVPVANQVPATAAPAADDDDAPTTRLGAVARRPAPRRQRPAPAEGDPPTTSRRSRPADRRPRAATARRLERPRPRRATAGGTRPTAAAPGRGSTTALDVLGRTTARKSKLQGARRLPELPPRVREHGDGRGRAREQAAVAADHRLAAVVGSTRPFKLKVSTRNLVRDRFLGAAAGRLLPGELVPQRRRACSAGTSTPPAGCSRRPARRPTPAAPEFFVATEDGGGGARPDSVTINVPGMPQDAGILQCTSWAGDGSHRTPMMTKANETPAIDSVRIFGQCAGTAPSRWT